MHCILCLASASWPFCFVSFRALHFNAQQKSKKSAVGWQILEKSLRSSSCEHAEVDSLEHGTSRRTHATPYPVSTKAQSLARRLDFAHCRFNTAEAVFFSVKKALAELGDQRSLLSGKHIYFISCRLENAARVSLAL
jgi:hypothetical protein